MEYVDQLIDELQDIESRKVDDYKGVEDAIDDYKGLND